MEHLPKKICQNGISYTLVGDYYIPDLQLPEESRPIGLWGRMHKAYLELCHPAQYNDLVLSGNLWTYLADLNEQAKNRLDCIIAQMKSAEGITEELKSQDQMAWVGAMNSIRNRAEEIVRHELISDAKTCCEMVLDDLYCGNIYPAEQVVPHEKEYRKLHRHTGELLTELEEKLSKEQMELVNQFHAHVIDVHCMELEAHFQYGFSWE